MLEESSTSTWERGMRRLFYLQVQMALMVGSSLVAVCAQDVGATDISQAYLVIAGGWGALGATSIPWSTPGRRLLRR
jgi:hypothetical protein